MYRSELLARRAIALNKQLSPGTLCTWWKRREDVGNMPGQVGELNAWGTSIDGHTLGAWLKHFGFVPFECVRVCVRVARDDA